MKKILFRSILALSTVLLFPFQVVEACTGFIVGKNLTADGTTLYGRTEDLEPNHNKVFLVHPRKTNAAGAKLVDESNGFSWTLPQESYKYTSVSDVTPADGIYDEVGFNEYGVSISATVSAKANDAIQKVDPYISNGLAESILTTVVLPHVQTAREGVELMAKIVEEQGAAEGNIVTIADKDGVWYMEILSGHQYVAIKFPDDKYAVFPNTFFLGSVNFSDTDHVIASKGVEEVAKKANSYKEINGQFHISQSYNPPMAEADRSRAWAGITSLDPNAGVSYDDPYFDLLHSTDRKISVADVMAMQRNRFEGTPFKPLDQMELDGKGIPQRGAVDPVYKYPLGNPNVMEAHIFQLKDGMPASMGGGTMWLAVGSPRFSPYLPYNGNITDTYSAYQVPTTSYSPDSWYWVASHIYDMAAKHSDLFGTSVQDKWKALEARLIEEQAGLDEANAALPDSAAKVTEESKERAEAVFKEMKDLEAEMEAKIKEATKTTPSSSNKDSISSSSAQSSSSSSSSATSSSSDTRKVESAEGDSLLDAATGIRLQNAELVRAGIQLSVKKLDSKLQPTDTYDISLTAPNGQSVHQVSPTLVTIPVRKDLPVDAVYALDENGKQVEKFDVTINQNQTISFTTDHFSVYQVQYRNEQSVKSKKKDLPSTGEQFTLLGIVGVILLAAAAFVLKQAKKH
ncbi:putative dipeptidase B [Streptococcus sp. DD11]|uniref:C69 family dipeptidase n=1 Tax=Streptococcus sp. DD11 TaxID=1777879 RepID=UPI000797AFE2|nr:C69 family dipeptidase [Streptococcus sp. DD11]KXT82222.1 putative dipeptidase B [Streptococcus sp. DD11]